MIERKDWEKVLKDNTESLEKMTTQFYLTKPQFEAMIALAKSELLKFPEEKKDADPAPEGIKQLTEEIKNA